MTYSPHIQRLAEAFGNPDQVPKKPPPLDELRQKEAEYASRVFAEKRSANPVVSYAQTMTFEQGMERFKECWKQRALIVCQIERKEKLNH